MTIDEVSALVRAQSRGHLMSKSAHLISLADALVTPRQIEVIARQVNDGRAEDEVLSVWLVAQETLENGYSIVLREDGRMFGLASVGFPADEHLVLIGWYSDLVKTFLSM